MNMALQIREVTRGASVLFPLEPELDESIRGYLARTADWNCFDSRTDLLRLSGITYVRRDLSDRIAAEISAVSAVLGIRSGALRRILNPTIDGNPEVVDYFGIPFQRRRLEIKNRRVSPASLRSSPHHRARWQIRLLPFCPESWEYLVDTCPSEACGKPLRWGDCLEVDRCEHCKFDLKLATAASVPLDLRETLKFVSDLLHPTSETRLQAVSGLPEPLNEVSPGEVFDLLCALTRSLTPDHLQSTSKPLDASHLARATQALLDYPLTFDQIALEGRSAAGSNQPPLFVKLRIRAKRKSSLQRAVILAMADRAETIHVGPARTPKRLEENGEWTFHRSATWLGIKLSEFQRIVAAGLAEPSRRGRARDIFWIRSSEVHAVGIALRRRMPMLEFVQSYGLPRSGVEQLVSLGLLEPCTEPVVRLLYPGFQLDRASVLRFVHQMANVFTPPPPDGIALEDVFHGVGGQEKPWGVVLSAALAGRIPGGLGLSEDERLRFERVTISKSFAWELLSRRRPDLLKLPIRSSVLDPEGGLTRIDAQRHLNCFSRDLDWLLAEGHLWMHAYGRTIRRLEVEALGRQLISPREISWRWRISPGMRDALPSEHGIGRALGPFWPRQSVEERFSALFG